MFTDSYLLLVTLLTGVHTADSYYKCWVQLLRADSADTSTFVIGKSVTEIEMRPEENSHAWGSWKKKKQTKDYSKVVKAQFICNSSERKIWNRWYDNYLCTTIDPCGYTNGTRKELGTIIDCLWIRCFLDPKDVVDARRLGIGHSPPITFKARLTVTPPGLLFSHSPLRFHYRDWAPSSH